MKPNIFEIATKELTQDAFFTWLLQFADQDCNKIDKELNQCGIDFINQLIKKQLPDFNEEINKVKARRQREKIDVWAEINDKYLIIIEDKTNTSHHSNQLARYKEIATKWCGENNYEKPICIYLKTGNESQSSLNKIKTLGYSIFNRLEFITLLNKYENINNSIFTDFKERLIRLEKSNNQFMDKNIGDWKSHDYEGFFQLLEKEMDILNWNYVNNPNGGFWNASLNWDSWDIYPTYIQLEEGKLCFKISTDSADVKLPENVSRSEIRNKLHNLIIKKAKEQGLNDIKKPTRFGNGKYMTAAIVERHTWLGVKDSKIEIEKVVENLKNYRRFLRDIIKSVE